MVSKKTITPRKQAVQARSKFTVEAVFEAAVQVFTENGYEGATTDLIAARAGVSVGTLYQYFPNKQAILIEIWKRNMENADKVRESFVSNHPFRDGMDSNVIKEVLKFIYQMHRESAKPHLFFEEVPLPDFIKNRMAEKEAIAIRMFQHVLEHCVNLRRGRLDIAARMMYEVMERLIHRYMTHFQNEMSEAEFIDEASDMICRYLFVDEK